MFFLENKAWYETIYEFWFFLISLYIWMIAWWGWFLWKFWRCGQVRIPAVTVPVISRERYCGSVGYNTEHFQEGPRVPLPYIPHRQYILICISSWVEYTKAKFFLHVVRFLKSLKVHSHAYPTVYTHRKC